MPQAVTVDELCLHDHKRHRVGFLQVACDVVHICYTT